MVDIDELVMIWNPQKVQMSPPPLKHNTHNISPKSDTPAIIDNNSDNNMPTPIHSTCPPHHHNICPLQNRPLTHNQLWLRTSIASMLTNSCPYLYFARIHLFFITDMCLQLKASSWKQSPLPLTPPFTSLVPSLARTQACP
jgi:hypothetical protein